MSEKPVLVRADGEKVWYNGNDVGRFGTEIPSGETVYVAWKNLFRIQNSYAFTIDLFDQFAHVHAIYIVDKESGELFKFSPRTYKRGRRVWANNQMQYAPEVTEADDCWPSSKGIIV